MTGDAVLLDLRPAQVPTRILGALIDLAVCALALYGWNRLVVRLAGSDARVSAFQLFGSIVITLAYPIITETLTRGRTLGLWALGLRVVRDDGGTIRFRHALIRWLMFWSVDFAIWTGLVTGLVCAALHPQSKRFGDLVAGTMVVRIRAPRALPLPEADPGLAGWAASADLSRVTDEQWQSTRMLVRRAAQLAAYPRETTCRAQAQRLAGRIAPPPPANTPPLDFLTALVAERRRRETAKIRSGGWVPDAVELPAGWR